MRRVVWRTTAPYSSAITLTSQYFGSARQFGAATGPAELLFRPEDQRAERWPASEKPSAVAAGSNAVGGVNSTANMSAYGGSRRSARLPPGRSADCRGHRRGGQRPQLDGRQHPAMGN